MSQISSYDDGGRLTEQGADRLCNEASQARARSARRERIATQLLAALLSGKHGEFTRPQESHSHAAVRHTDALITELDR